MGGKKRDQRSELVANSPIHQSDLKIGVQL